MNTKQYGIRKKGDGDYILTYKQEWKQGVCGFIDSTYLLDEFSRDSHDDWLGSIPRYGLKRC